MRKRTVLSLEQALSLSYGTLRFVHLGWRVIRLEAVPARGRRWPGDPNRYVGRRLAEPDRCSYFIAPNVGKESITLDLKDPRGRGLLHRIVRELPVDVFCCNTLPRRYRELGVDFETLSRLNPDLIWVGVSAFGPGHPDRPGYDPALQAKLGFMALTGEPEGPPTLCGVPVIDLKAGDEVFAQVMMAMAEQAEERERDGKAEAKRIDISMAHGAASWLQTTLPHVDMGAAPEDLGRWGSQHRQFVPVNVYRARDGYIYLAVGNDIQWKRLVELPAFRRLDRPQWAGNEGRRRDREEINRLIEKAIAEMKTQELVAELSRRGIVASEVNEVADLPALSEIAPCLGQVEFPPGARVRLPPSALMGSRAARSFAPAPRYGAHTRSVLAEVGLEKDALDAMEREGVIATPHAVPLR